MISKVAVSVRVGLTSGSVVLVGVEESSKVAVGGARVSVGGKVKEGVAVGGKSWSKSWANRWRHRR